MVKEVVFKRLEAAVEVVKQDVPVKVEAAVVEVVEEVLSEEVEAASSRWSKKKWMLTEGCC